MFACRSLLAVLIFAGTLFAQTFNFESRPYANSIYGKAQWRADLNGDGREDVISLNTGGGPASFNVMLSNGDGSYGAPQAYEVDPNVGNVFLTFGDFNSDGKIDIIACTGNKNQFLEFLNNGDGTLRLQATFVTPVPVWDVAAADWNRDGKIDLAYTYHSSTTGEIHMLFGTGTGGFSIGPVINSTWTYGHIYMGDVDGDGKADLITVDNVSNQVDVAVFYGDNTGHFPVTTHFRDTTSVQYVPFDVDGDGRMDLIGVPWIINQPASPNVFYPKLRVIYGNAARTLSGSDIPIDACADPDSLPAVADFNGDGKPDIMAQTFPCGATGPYTVRGYAGQGNRTFAAGQLAYAPSDFIRAMLVLKGNDDIKPDLVVTPDDSPARIELLVNNTSGGVYPGCQADKPIGIRVCFGSSGTSPALFSIGAAGPTEMRKIEVWIDGAKKLESLRSFSHYAFLDATTPVSNGTHTITIYAAGWDNLLQKTSYQLYVSSPGATCGTPTTANAISICAPVNGSTVNSPVYISAAGGSAVTFMEVWMGSAKLYQTSGNHVETKLSMASGSHTVTIYGRNASGVVGQSTVTFTVASSGSGGPCSQPPASATATIICSPTANSTVTSPVSVQAAGGSSVNFMEVWLDGTKRFQTTGNTVSQSYALAAGSHHLTVYGKNGSTVLSKAVSDFTVQ